MTARNSPQVAPQTGVPDIVFIKVGWWLFVICAISFCAVAILNRDWLSLFGSLAFLLANVAFMIPLYRGPK